jgi:DNA-binding NtrC family response regulator
VEENRVLLREDDRDLAQLVIEILEDAGYQVIHVIEIDDLLHAAKKNSPCVALVDGMHPARYDLWWLGPELRKLGVPPLAFTAHASARTEFAADSHGYVGVVTKPFDADEFLSLVNQVCWEDYQAVAS